MTDEILELTRLRTLSRAAATRRAYAADWKDFAGWCAAEGYVALPANPVTVALYLADRGRTRRPSTLHRRICAIGQRHRSAGLPFDPKVAIVQETLAALDRSLGTAPAQKAALSVDDLRRMVMALPTTPSGCRDRAILLLGFGGAFRRGELAALDIADLGFSSAGLLVRLRRTKEDQSAGETVGIPRGRQPETCPVSAVRQWIMAARLSEGPLFRPVDAQGNIRAVRLSGAAIAKIVKRAVLRSGLATGLTRAGATARAEAVSGHSLRSGFVTAAAQAGVPEWNIMRITRHKRPETLRRYIRIATALEDHPAEAIGL